MTTNKDIASAKREFQVNLELSILNQSCNELTDIVSILEDRLTNILTLEPTCQVETDKNEKERVPLAKFIRNESDRIAYTVHKLVSLINRIEL